MFFVSKNTITPVPTTDIISATTVIMIRIFRIKKLNRIIGYLFSDPESVYQEDSVSQVISSSSDISSDQVSGGAIASSALDNSLKGVVSFGTSMLPSHFSLFHSIRISPWELISLSSGLTTSRIR